VVVQVPQGEHGGFVGPYADWEAAVAASTGYDSEEIFRKTCDARLKVLRGEAAYERDSVLFDHVEHSWPLLAHLLWIASLKGNRLRVVDFGGSLGSSYFQNLVYLRHLTELNWCVVEQPRHVDFGKARVADGRLSFAADLDAALASVRPDVALFSGVLMYLQDPWEALGRATEHRVPFVLMDRTLVIGEATDRLMVQVVPPSIFRASYPCWFLSETKLIDTPRLAYDLVAQFPVPEEHVDQPGASFKGFVFRLRA
jgi:putative methyltransferase (TIGR04325 family)